jgi:putative transposase
MRLRSAADGKRTGFNYTGTHRYILTLPTYRTRPIFAENRMVVAILDVLRETARDGQFDVFAYCFVPDRLILVIHGKTATSDMKVFFSTFRQRSSSAVEADLGHPLWKRTFLERVLRRGEESKNVARDLFRLPVTQGLSASPAAYPYLGSFTEDVRSLLRPVARGRRRRFRR